MGSPLAPILANIFMRWFEEKLFLTYTGTLPKVYRRYVDDSFLLFENKDDVKPFFHFANDIHPNIKFTKDEESAERKFFPFLDVKISRFNDRFHTQTYYKPTHTGLYIHKLV